MLRKLLDNIPVTVTLERVLDRLKIEEEEDVELISELFETAKKTVKPKALYKEAFVEEINGKNVRINGCDFESDVLAVNLKDIHRVFAYICTCGTEVDDWSHIAGEKDYVVSLWLDMIKEMFLHDARAFLWEHLKSSFKFNKLASVNPGSGNVDNWHISQRKNLFDMIGDVKSDIGVTLTESFLMLPTKSSSGLLYPSEKDFANCSLCSRENCVGRRADFDKKLYDSIFK